jgi:hypothetical protein
MHNKYIITYKCHDNALRMWKVVQLEKYFYFSLLSLTSLLSAPEREVTSLSDFKVVGALEQSKSGLLRPLKRGWIHMKFSTTGQEKGDCLGRLDCTCIIYNLYNY